MGGGGSSATIDGKGSGIQETDYFNYEAETEGGTPVDQRIFDYPVELPGRVNDCAVVEELRRFGRRYDASKYDILGPNSNTFVRQGLKHVLGEDEPPAPPDAIGWNDPAGDALARGAGGK
jgi:hypothetical protein